jgi:hypothetical protein
MKVRALQQRVNPRKTCEAPNHVSRRYSLRINLVSIHERSDLETLGATIPKKEWALFHK